VLEVRIRKINDIHDFGSRFFFLSRVAYIFIEKAAAFFKKAAAFFKKPCIFKVLRLTDYFGESRREWEKWRPAHGSQG
jgi:hypothetical protein